MGVTFVGRMGIAENGQPVAAVSKGEEGIGILWQIVDEGDIELLRQRQGLAIDAGTSEDEDLFLSRLAGSKGSGKGGEDFGAREGEGGVVAQDEVTAVGQGTVRERLEGLASHDDGMARSKRLETLQVIRQVVEQLPCPPDGVVLSYGNNDGKHIRQKLWRGYGAKGRSFQAENVFASIFLFWL